MRNEEKVSILFTALMAVSGAMVGLIVGQVMGLQAAVFTLAAISSVIMLALFVEFDKPVGSLVDQLLDEMGFGSGGAESYYRAVSGAVLQRACELDEEPKSMGELVARLDYWVLCAADAQERMKGITAKNVDTVRIRCEALPDHVAERLFKDREKTLD